ncbi:PspA/IM30 family protein [Aureibacillus halotolerans]|uniref:Phage shock protein A (PspA) family protein n=1 Tax=Aureibacillus halotolerans TaxID=1508390 RepID=A0A4R6TW49_9BACI|nr:PspA/IM30 family protein [Aureibacillus halotolerans]TDQ36229.1 phage shock protein A (PspA) family protein [Aureibacillus halotolerans]
MSILKRFQTIMNSNIHALIDRSDDPDKIIKEALNSLRQDLGSVKSETSAIEAQTRRAQRALNECETSIEAMQRYAIKAVDEGNDVQARQFLQKKETFVLELDDLHKVYRDVFQRAEQMKQIEEKLASDLEALKSRKAMLETPNAIDEELERALLEVEALAELRNSTDVRPSATNNIDTELEKLKKQRAEHRQS